MCVCVQASDLSVSVVYCLCFFFCIWAGIFIFCRVTVVLCCFVCVCVGICELW